MSETRSAPASFVNLDLELLSEKEPVQLAAELGRTSFVLFSGPTPDGHLLCVEPVIGGLLSTDIEACTEHFLKLLETLTPEGDAQFRACRSRVFDYGFDGGFESNPIHVDLASGQLARIAALDLNVRITTYPYRAAAPENES